MLVTDHNFSSQRQLIGPSEHTDCTRAATATAAATDDREQRASHRSMSNIAPVDLGQLGQLHMHAARVVAGCANRLAAVEGAGEVQIGAARHAGVTVYVS